MLEFMRLKFKSFFFINEGTDFWVMKTDSKDQLHPLEYRVIDVQTLVCITGNINVPYFELNRIQNKRLSEVG